MRNPTFVARVVLALWILPPGAAACGGRTAGQNVPDASPDGAVDARPDATVTPYCGDGHKDPAEFCDGADLGGSTCVGLGYDDGVLACTTACALDDSGCFRCGDGLCALGENHVTCPADCPGVTQVAASFFHTCALLTTGEVWC